VRPRFVPDPGNDGVLVVVIVQANVTRLRVRAKPAEQIGLRKQPRRA
jgi:hypothetical protein